LEKKKMKDLKAIKDKHMTIDERLEIQLCLDRGMTFKAIAEQLGRDQTTVSKEVKKHLSPAETRAVTKFYKDGRPIPPTPCPSLLKAPFVCNSCKKRHTYCGFQKQLYKAKTAQSQYEQLRSEAREGTPLNKNEFYEMDKVVSNGIKHGQHLYHILQTNNLGISKSTVYRHLKKGYLSVSALNFPRVVKFKPRREKLLEYIPKAAKIGRTYDEFISFTEGNGISSWVEMDTVIGRIGGKVILTLDFTFCNFMAALLLENKTALEVSEKIKALKAEFVKRQLRFGDVFPLLLTDNGGEFANAAAIENDLSGEKETSLFFCDPYKSCQKPKVEKNHTLFRDIVPKGESFDSFSQSIVNKIFSHVNSIKRKSLNGKSPLDIFSFTYGKKVAAILGIMPVPPNEVIQSPKLLRTLNSGSDEKRSR
jgi:IS30 family transposase